jgi:cellulose biosynthesis protein BcsQ
MYVIGAEDITSSWLEKDVRAATGTVQRTIFDLGPASAGLLPQIFSMCSVLLVPVLTDLNSILTIPRIEASVKAMRDKGLNVPLPVYVSNKFDESNAMEQQARTLIQRQCGERLLPFTIRRSPDVAEAISGRMTVADHSPESEVTHDFTELAVWLRQTAPVRQAVTARNRWSER